ncbi:MAG: type II toxin-antitoxin system VapC family toxin [Desulfatibacillaceae bacterium]
MRYMLDTNICIYLIKKKPTSVVERLRALPISQVSISSITLAELEYGVAKSSRPEQNRDALTGFLAPMETEVFGNEAAACYGALRSGLEKIVKPIGAMDILIAAHALSLSTVLVTNNNRESGQVPGLVVEDWVTAYPVDMPV